MRMRETRMPEDKDGHVRDDNRIEAEGEGKH